jgi:hypothetical protein
MASIFSLAVGAVFILGATASAVAGPIQVGSWSQFFSDPSNNPPFAAACLGASELQCPPVTDAMPLDSPPWTFAASSPVRLTITDLHLPGDRFDVFDFGTLIGSTPSVSFANVSCGFDPNSCLADPLVSHAAFQFSAGPHSVTVLVVPAELNVEGVFRIDPVPEPTTLVFWGTGAAGLGLARWRRRRTGQRRQDCAYR